MKPVPKRLGAVTLVVMWQFVYTRHGLSTALMLYSCLEMHLLSRGQQVWSVSGAKTLLKIGKVKLLISKQAFCIHYRSFKQGNKIIIASKLVNHILAYLYPLTTGLRTCFWGWEASKQKYDIV